jgi:cardiolipin synthase
LSAAVLNWPVISELWAWISALVGLLFWIGGVIAVFHAVMHVQSERGAVAWCIGLLAMPIVVLPAYLVFGRQRFLGYREAIEAAMREHEERIKQARERMAAHRIEEGELPSPMFRSLAAIGRYPFTAGNAFQLLVDGERSFDAIEEEIRKAEEYVLFQFFIVHADGLGNRLKDVLLERARAGVRVHFLFDEIGSHALPKAFIRELREGGIEVEAFGTRRGSANRFQVNFRNHRKIVVVDGKVAFVGGHNVGDEYLGKHEKLSPWRDTHVRIAGPAVLQCQGVFLSDWYWATREIPEVRTDPVAVEDGSPALILPSGPALDTDVCPLAFQALVQGARERLWIASPYLVPDQSLLVALKFAARRGIDVRLMIPANPDHLVVYLAAFSFYEELIEAGVKILRYRPGFMHQKVVLVDDEIAGVGTVNLDPRSFRLNFEVTAFFAEPGFIREIEEMFERDFGNCDPGSVDDYRGRSLPRRFAIRAARLFSPIL